MQRVGVLGAGVMGSGIAQVTVTAGYPTVGGDIDVDVVRQAEVRCGPAATGSTAPSSGAS